MFKFGIIGLFFIIGLMIIPVNFVSAQSDSSFVSTDKSNYQAGDIIHITGSFPGNLVYVKILDPNGASVTGGWQSASVSPFDNTFEISFDADWRYTGTYVVEIMSQGQDLFEETTFYFKISDKDQAELDAKEKEKQERIEQLEAQEKAEQKEKISQLEAEQQAQEEKIAQLEAEQNGGGCLIATATYGSELAPQVQQLRELRDNQLLNTESGTAFMGAFNDIYYSFSPIVADYERENPYFKEAVKLAITPLISSLSILNHVDMDSESEVLGYGISLILLNLGMYLGVPAVVIIGIRKIK